ncbi:MAG: 2-oxoacid:acceptor oxidoreductase family protein [Eubacteriales bacterium]|jgi:2-oxoglutarate ferredoxin oxidoreductase subunit gamma|nr:2-oxoacid:acceptor oxidoreductase family protein [Eubacteriales bacterium]
MTREILIAGFGGQGILFGGKALAYLGMVNNLEVSWLPSYGPEMRGGTANCHVIISDKPIGSPIVVSPTDLIVMNLPSFEKFKKNVAKGGNIFADSSLIDKVWSRKGINKYDIPATQMASEMGNSKLANMILLGKMLSTMDSVFMETIKKALEMSIPPSKMHLLDINLKAIEAGFNYN